MMATPSPATNDERRNGRRRRRGHHGMPFALNESANPDDERWYRTPLPPPGESLSLQVRLRAETVWRYLSFLSPERSPPRDLFLRALERQFLREESIFLWESVILTCIDIPYIRDELDPDTYDRLLDTRDVPTLVLETEHIPVHDINMLETPQVLSSRWCDLPQQTRDECGMSSVLHFFMRSDSSYVELDETEDAAMARLSAARVMSSRADEKINPLKRNRQLWENHLGAMCSACEKISRNCKKCAACEQVFYCGKECQKRDWPIHKPSCKAHIAKINAQVAAGKENIADVSQS